MSAFRLLSPLLQYPGAETEEAAAEVRRELERLPPGAAREGIASFLAARAGMAEEEAQAAYEKALSFHPVPIEAAIFMANLFTDTGQVERAEPLLREALKTNPNHAEAHWELGYA